ncbi:hypothetical protein AN639_02050 [Candidatus Epulonipiscium fishelsonii]|uniref:Uncharacterized protein n=1 Tax=Candidatus Epulonipiscium fishelsonii TaxID=77094 RepID=A0ACC8XFV3_9FIRM|nr:hypothetical protein AN396_02185 [Epulopiscium sp. SCG-B11WGA-EpuloA1]ONI43857.1 hypothetical protein AN639_02050 [Epulopiscium sp. SCG-B05WGA-EpuloA1]
MSSYIKLYWKQSINVFYVAICIGCGFIGVDLVPKIFKILQGNSINNLLRDPTDLFAITIIYGIILGISGMKSWFNAFMNMKANRKQIFLGIVIGGITMTMSIFFILYIINIVIINVCNNFFPMLNLTNTFGSSFDGMFDLSTMVFLCLTIFSVSNLVGSFIVKFQFQRIITLLCFIVFVIILLTALGFGTPILIMITLVQGNNIFGLFILSILCVISIGISYIISRKIAIH